MTELLAVGAGGFIGSCLRFVITKKAGAMSASFPWGTLLSNAAAGLLIGVAVGLEYRPVVLPQRAKLFLTAGFLGGLSTFSAFSLDTVHLFMAGRYLSASVNILTNLGLGLSGVVAGMFMAKLV